MKLIQNKPIKALSPSIKLHCAFKAIEQRSISRAFERNCEQLEGVRPIEQGCAATVGRATHQATSASVKFEQARRVGRYAVRNPLSVSSTENRQQAAK